MLFRAGRVGLSQLLQLVVNHQSSAWHGPFGQVADRWRPRRSTFYIRHRNRLRFPLLLRHQGPELLVDALQCRECISLHTVDLSVVTIHRFLPVETLLLQRRWERQDTSRFGSVDRSRCGGADTHRFCWSHRRQESGWIISVTGHVSQGNGTPELVRIFHAQGQVSCRFRGSRACPRTPVCETFDNEFVRHLVWRCEILDLDGADAHRRVAC
mmetsp:Transcript_23579/g.62101  ORF Transcript_23579/g.62101 Transcript_23579/m.62101 type:complete len:212 (-) Transcript_23579:1562-2197(-)